MIKTANSGIGTESRPTLHVLFFAAGSEPSSERYFMDKPLLTEACSDANNAEIIVITWNLPICYHNNFEFLFLPGNETNLPHIGFCLSVVLAHGGTGGETCMDVLVISADVKPRPLPTTWRATNLKFNRSIFRSVS